MARIPYPTPESLELEAAEALAGMKPMNVFRMLARADTLAPPIFEAATRLFTRGRTELTPRLRQFAILRVAGAANFNYLVAHHEPISLRVGLTPQEVQAGLSGDETQLGEQERAIVRFAGESTLQADVSDAAFDAVRAFLSDRQIAELAIVVGLYNCLGRFLTALRVETEPPAAA
jgi:alkylhydroperoxidase family enzyme